MGNIIATTNFSIRYVPFIRQVVLSVPSVRLAMINLIKLTLHISITRQAVKLLSDGHAAACKANNEGQVRMKFTWNKIILN